jgi:hypothetical protein
MSPNVQIKRHGERKLVDWVSISGALIFIALMCSCIVLLARGANQLATTQAEAVLRVPTPAASSQPPRSISTPEADAKSVTTTTQRESYHIAFVSPSVDSSSKVPSQPTKQAESRGATDKQATANPKSANAIRGHRRNLLKARVAKHRRSTFRAIALRFVSRVMALVADD